MTGRTFPFGPSTLNFADAGRIEFALGLVSDPPKIRMSWTGSDEPPIAASG